MCSISTDGYNYMQIGQLVVPDIFAVLVNFTLAAQQIAKITTLYTSPSWAGQLRSSKPISQCSPQKVRPVMPYNIYSSFHYSGLASPPAAR
ncbi:hypothetical protein ANTRET_LOCUS152 [Anthophora retusa]